MSRQLLSGLLFTALTLTPPAAARAQESHRAAGTRYALLVGVDGYAQLQKLEFPAADVTDLAKVLVDSAGYRADHVVLMTQAKSAENLRFAPEAKKIGRELETLLNLCEPSDSVLIALAGHGVQFQGEAENYFCPADADLADKSTLVPLGEVYRKLERCKAGFKLLLVDACRDDPRATGSRSADGSKVEDVVRLKRLPPPGGVAAFFSCAEGEKAFEHRDLRHGVFFHFVIEGLKGRAADRDGQVELPDLEKYVKREVKAFVYQKYGVSQRPEVVNKTQDLVPLLSAAAVQYNRGNTQFKQHEFEQAVEAYTQAIRADGEFAAAYAMRSLAWDDVKSMAPTARTNRAIEDAVQALRLAPTLPLAICSRGNACSTSGDKERALAEYSKAIQLDPKLVMSYLGRSVVLIERDDYERAFADVTEAIRLDPQNSTAYDIRAIIYRKRREYDRAITDTTEAIRLAPKNSVAYNNRGTVHDDVGDYDRAIADYNEALRLDPMNSQFIFNRGLTYHRKGAESQAIADFTSAIQLDPKKALYYANRSAAYNSLGDSDRAIADGTEAIRLDSTIATAYHNRGLAYLHKGEFDRCIVDCTEAVRLNPKSDAAFNNRGMAYIKRGDFDRCIADCTEALRLNPRNASAYNNRGWAYNSKGDYGRGLADLNESIRLNPRNAYAYVNRSNSYQMLGYPSYAQTDLQTARQLGYQK